MEALTKQVGSLADEREKLRRRIRKLEEKASNLSAQKMELTEAVEILTKEKEVLQQTIKRLDRAARKNRRKGRGKETKPLTR